MRNFCEVVRNKSWVTVYSLKKKTHQHNLYDFLGCAPSEGVEFQAEPISVRLIKGEIASSMVSIHFHSHPHNIRSVYFF